MKRMIKRAVMTGLAVFFPWVVFLIYDNPGGAVVALFMQATIIGWIPATFWALRTMHGNTKKVKTEKV